MADFGGSLEPSIADVVYMYGINIDWTFWGVLLFLAIHLMVWIRFTRGFRRARRWYGATRSVVEKTFREAFEGDWPALSVIVAAHNEEVVLPRLLDALAQQTYDRFEVIVVDDGSTDETAAIVEQRIRADERIRLIRQDHAGKKAAVGAAVAAARHPVCVFTDADCRPGREWLAAHARAHRGISEAVVVGYSPLEGSASWQVRFQQFDASLNQFLAAAAIGDGQAYLARGGNMSYSRRLHEEVGGFSGHTHHISGDDTLFIQAVRSRTAAMIRWLDVEEIIVPSPAREGFGAWLRQKRRQTSTGATFDRVGISRAGQFYWTLLSTVVLAAVSGWAVLGMTWLLLSGVFAVGLVPVVRAFRRPFSLAWIPLFLPVYVLFIALVPVVGMLFPPKTWQPR